MKALFRIASALVLSLVAVTNLHAQLFRASGSGSGSELTIEVLDVGQGDSILIRTPEGKVALIDAGPSHEVLSKLKARGITSVDLVAVSHHHTDHYGGMDDVVRFYHPKYYLATNSSHTTSQYLRLLKDVQAAGCIVVQPTKQARRIELGSVILTILPQGAMSEKEENDNSIGLRLQYGGFSMLMTGDSEEPERGFWVNNCPELLKNCTVLKLAHHGSRNGTDARWLGLVQPKLTVASLGKGNDYKHPHKETVNLLAKTGIKFLRTDEVGTITIRTDGKKWSVDEPRSMVADRSKSPEDRGVKPVKR